jgi:hypothetical protein
MHTVRSRITCMHADTQYDNASQTHTSRHLFAPTPHARTVRTQKLPGLCAINVTRCTPATQHTYRCVPDVRARRHALRHRQRVNVDVGNNALCGRMSLCERVRVWARLCVFVCSTRACLVSWRHPHAKIWSPQAQSTAHTHPPHIACARHTTRTHTHAHRTCSTNPLNLTTPSALRGTEAACSN